MSSEKKNEVRGNFSRRDFLRGVGTSVFGSLLDRAHRDISWIIPMETAKSEVNILGVFDPDFPPLEGIDLSLVIQQVTLAPWIKDEGLIFLYERGVGIHLKKTNNFWQIQAQFTLGLASLYNRDPKKGTRGLTPFLPKKRATNKATKKN
jgi:hypothetical protein